ncbi:2Fe-2S iron-sulfur cluster-binding protein [Pelagibius marinus]|uniref:2Fe-2S iron-sulfur cluster-binding protein n=1 Tax=Pelagibius marinus TaxID=2762760 RepID=UPI001D050731|nr:2Fe-2S iron-sulfur cluster-binding protein [Pelagibius marinus]
MDNDTFKARIISAERALTLPADKTLLETALDAGIAYPHGCRSGRCGACKTRLLSGEVELLPHTRFALSEDEREQGLILACRAKPLSDIEVKWLAQETVSHPLVKTTGSVAGTRRLTHDIVELRLGLEAPFAYAPGQYARLTFPGLPARDYSMAPSGRDDELVFHIREVAGGRVSAAVAQAAKPGVAVQVEGPFGEAYLREGHTRPILAVAGGSGLAPVLSIVSRAVAADMRQPIHVYFGARDRHDVYGQQQLDALMAAHPRFSRQVVLSAAKGETAFRKGFVHEAIAADIDAMAGWKAYVAGPPAMVEAVGQVCRERNLRETDLHADVFFTPEDGSRASAEAASGG